MTTEPIQIPWGGRDFPGTPNNTTNVPIPAFSSDANTVVVPLTDDEIRMLKKLIDRNYGYTAPSVMRLALRKLYKSVEV